MGNATETTAPITTLQPVVQKLKMLLESDSNLKIALESSLRTASRLGNENLDPQLYAGLNEVFKNNAWPVTIEEYYNYLDQYVVLIPNEEISKNYPKAWKSGPKENGYNQKVLDLLCHFYWLIDQKEPDTKVTVQNYPEFAAWLVKFAKEWGQSCNNVSLFNEKVKASFKKNGMYNWDLYSDNASSWTTFNEFFYREFNQAAAGTGITPLRPITDPTNNKTIVAPADCTFKASYSIDQNGHITDSSGVISTVTLKHTHTVDSISQLLDGSIYADAFYGGTFVHYFLGPFDYHRFHTPVSGEILEIKELMGNVFLNVTLKGKQFHAPDSGTNGYEFSQSRGLVIMDTVELGKVAILPIGMAQVSGVLMNTDLNGKEVVKGQEFGKFQFGGSDIIMLFERSPEELYMFKEDPGQNPIHFQYGQAAVLAI